MQDLAYQKLRSMFSAKQCPHFNSSFANRQILSQKPAILYLKLRNSGCKKHAAINFCKRPNCKNDVTKSVDGPLCCRVLKPKVTCTTMHENGWQAAEPDYDMDKKYYLSSKDVLLIDEETKEQTERQQQQLKSDYNKKIQAFTDYYQEIKDSYNLSGLSQTDLLNRVKQINQQNEEEIRESADQLLKGNCLPLRRNDLSNRFLPKKKYSNNLISEFNVFPKVE